MPGTYKNIAVFLGIAGLLPSGFTAMAVTRTWARERKVQYF